MKYTHLTTLACALGCLASGAPAHATAWTRAEGGYYTKAWARLVTGNKLFDAGGAVLDMPERYRDLAVNLYGEYGLTDRITVIGFALPYGNAGYDGEGVNYVGAVGGGLRLGQALGPLRLAGEMRYGYAPDAGAGIIGQGVVEGTPFFLAATVPTHRIEGALQLGMSLPFGWWAASLGMRAFSEPSISPAVVGFGQLGWQINPRWVLDGHVNLNLPTDDVEVVNVLGAGQTAYVGIGFGLTWWFLERLGLHAGVEGVAFAESNAAAPSITLGFEARGD